MDPLDFLAAVLPTTGYYCVAEFDTPRLQHIFVQTKEEILHAAEELNQKKINVYFALANFATPASRVGSNAVSFRSIFLDVDVGAHKKSPYKTKKEAILALAKFVEDAQLPQPWVTTSGNGVHAYWPFTEDIPRERWYPTAERFKLLCKKHELTIDYAVTADAARVLRMPGTTNYFYKDRPKEAKVLLEGDPPTDFAALEARLQGEINGYEYVKSVESAIPGTPLTGTALSATAVKMFENTATSFRTILRRTAEGTGCSQLQYYIDNAAVDGMEPLWRAMLSIAKHCDDGAKAAVKLSDMHPYDHARMATKLREIKGPYTCESIESINPGGCEGCPNKGKVKSPVVLGRELLLADSTQETTIVNESAPQIQYTRPPPPYGFFYGQKGGVYTKIKVKDAEGEEVSKDICVVPYDVFVTGSLTQDADRNMIHVVACQPSGTKEIAIPARALVSKDDTLKVLGAHLVYSANSNDKQLYEYVKRSASDMTVLRGPRKIPDTYGWQAEGSFVIGGKEYAPDGSIRTAPTGDDHSNLLNITTPQGDIDVWRSVVKMVIEKKRYDILLTMLVSFGAPLMEFTGFSGMLVNVQSHETGTGKSVGLSLAASVYGHPSDYLVTPDTSVVTTQLRMGLLHSLPLIMDEVTYKTRTVDGSDQDWASKFLLDLTMGKSKERMEAAVTKERKNIVRWSTLALMSSNSSIVDALTSRNYTTNGELQRLLEIDMHDKLVLTREDEELLGKLRTNFGVAGHKYIKWLVLNHKAAISVLEDIRAALRVRFEMESHERFWLNGLSCMIAGAVLASGAYSGVVNLPIKEILGEARKLLNKSRAVVTGNVRSAYDVLHAFIRENYGNFIIVRKRQGELALSLGVREVVDESIVRSAVKGRIEHGFKDGVALVFIEKGLLAHHCHRMSYNSAAFKKDIAEKYVITEDIKKNLFAYTKVKSVRVNTVCIELPETELDDAPAPA